MSYRNCRGFTLIELMITVAIVAILASVALPSYQEYVKRGNRAAAQAQMMDIANLEQQYILANRVYTATGSEFGYALPSNVGAHYSYAITVNNVGPPPSFTITFTPSGTQTSDGPLVLTSAGVKTRAGDPAKW
ncbi:MAG: type IV pilin protein [Rhodocyclaceae bacterium]|nr:type IV pilin protein [Rhodocyclaceae bacterium]